MRTPTGVVGSYGKLRKPKQKKNTFYHHPRITWPRRQDNLHPLSRIWYITKCTPEGVFSFRTDMFNKLQTNEKSFFFSINDRQHNLIIKCGRADGRTDTFSEIFIRNCKEITWHILVMEASVVEESVSVPTPVSASASQRYAHPHYYAMDMTMSV